MTTTDEFAYALLDRESRNLLGEWNSYEEAEETYLSYVRAAGKVVESLELWHGDERIHVDPDKIGAVTAA